MHLMDDISFLFKNEFIWSGNRYDADKFAGGLSVEDKCPGPICRCFDMPPLLQVRLSQ